jgi:hypothetical protein
MSEKKRKIQAIKLSSLGAAMENIQLKVIIIFKLLC